MQGEFVGEVYVVVSCGEEICAGGVECHASASVVGYFQVSRLTALGGNQDHAGRCCSTIDGARRSILQDGHRLDVVRIHLCQ